MGMQLIETIEVGSGGAASIEFTSIPQDGVDLVCVLSGMSDQSSPYSAVGVFLDGDTTTTNYNTVNLYGNTYPGFSQIVSGGGNFRPFIRIPGSDNTNAWGNTQIYVSNYTSSTNKSLSSESVTETDQTSGGVQEVSLMMVASSHTSSSGTDALTLTGLSCNFKQYSTASLYKITAD